MPNVNASASHSWNIGLNQNITTGLLENQTTQFTSAGLNVGVDIYNGLQNQNAIEKIKFIHNCFSISIDKNARRYCFKCSQCLFANFI